MQMVDQLNSLSSAFYNRQHGSHSQNHQDIDLMIEKVKRWRTEKSTTDESEFCEIKSAIEEIEFQLGESILDPSQNQQVEQANISEKLKYLHFLTESLYSASKPSLE